MKATVDVKCLGSSEEKWYLMFVKRLQAVMCQSL